MTNDTTGRLHESDSGEDDHAVDVTKLVCPMTYVRVRLALDGLPAGGVLRVLLKGPDARANVPRTAAEQGHAVLSVMDEADRISVVRIRKHA